MTQYITITLALLVGSSSTALAERFEVRPGTGSSTVRFDSRAPVESFHGETDRVEGHITSDLNALADSIEVRLAVDLASLDTGIDLRNRHMRENHLETDAYPKALFEGARLVTGVGSSLAAGVPTRFDVEGSLTLHGVTRTIRVPVDVTLLTGDERAIRVSGAFRIGLSDYEIKRPKFLFLKLSEEQAISFDILAHSRP